MKTETTASLDGELNADSKCVHQKLKQVKRLPSTSFTNLASLPASCGVYFICLNDAVLYVGQAKNIKRRLLSHNKINDFRGVLRWLSFYQITTLKDLTVRCHTTPTVEDAQTLEALYIKALVPTLNFVESRENLINYLLNKDVGGEEKFTVWI